MCCLNAWPRPSSRSGLYVSQIEDQAHIGCYTEGTNEKAPPEGIIQIARI